MESEGLPSIWFTFTAADNHWLDLFRLLKLDTAEYDALRHEHEKAKYRRKLVRENPHIVDAFFYKRVEDLLNSFFEGAGLKAKWTWF